MFLGIPFVFSFFVFQSLLQGWGDTRTPLYLMALGVGLNVIADPFFILGFQDNVLFSWVGLESLEATLFELTGFTGFGVQGAAIATILTRGIGAAIGIWLLLSGRVGIELVRTDFLPERETIRKLFRIGVPASLEVSTKALSVTILTALVAITSVEAVAAYGIGTRVTSMVVLPALGLARGVETVVGQNLGANQRDRAVEGVRAALGLVVAAFAVLSVVVYVFAGAVIDIFVTGTGSVAVIAVGAEYLRVVGATYVFLGGFYVIQGGFRGSGRTRLALLFAFLGYIVLRSLIAYVLAVPLDWGASGIWYGEAGSNILMAAAVGAYFLRGTWTSRVVDDDVADASATASMSPSESVSDTD
jgi:putative MATE family efflux protein